LTKDEFINEYCERSGISRNDYFYNYNLIALPCKCGHETCNGWATVTNEDRYIKIHNELYNR
jgi:hypothetical protein